MKLLTKAIQAKLPAMGSQDGKPAKNVRVIAKFFNPTGAGTWYATEYDPKERIFFGYVNLLEKEHGSFSLDELESVRCGFGLGIERDIYWSDTTTLQDVIDGRAT